MTAARARVTLTLVGALAVSLVLTACLPPLAPRTLPPTTIPTATPQRQYTGITTVDGFSPQQHTAVRIRVSDCSGWANGSGFILDEGTVITNAHVIEDALWIQVTTYDGHDYTAVSSQIAPVADLGIIHLDPVFTDFVTLADTPLEYGDEVQVVGYPEGQALTVEEGTYVGTEADTVGSTGEDVQSFRAYTLPGNSGSPIFDADGKVVSVLYASDSVSWSAGWDITWLNELIANPQLWQANTATC